MCSWKAIAFDLHFDDFYYRCNRKRLIVHRNVLVHHRVSRFSGPEIEEINRWDWEYFVGYFDIEWQSKERFLCDGSLISRTVYCGSEFTSEDISNKTFANFILKKKWWRMWENEKWSITVRRTWVRLRLPTWSQSSDFSSLFNCKSAVRADKSELDVDSSTQSMKWIRHSREKFSLPFLFADELYKIRQISSWISFNNWHNNSCASSCLLLIRSTGRWRSRASSWRTSAASNGSPQMISLWFELGLLRSIFSNWLTNE